jgi:acetyl esterase/lipase
VLLRFLGALGRTTAARLRRGPLRPTWSFPFEASVAFLRATAAAASGRPPLGQRAVWAALRAPPSPVRRRVKRALVAGPGFRAEWFVPTGGHGDAVIVYLHGGAYLYGSMKSHAELVTRLALAASARVLAVDYTLAPEATFPVAQDEVRAACRWLGAQGVPPAKILLAGDSAGGNLAITTLLAQREHGEPLPAGAIGICPWVDMQWQGGSYDTNAPYDWALTADIPLWAAAYAGGADLASPRLSPIHADLAGLPPLCLLWGEREMLRDQVVAFADRARAAGVDVTAREFPEMIHNWMTLYTATPEAEKAFVMMGEFARRAAGSGVSPASR